MKKDKIIEIEIVSEDEGTSLSRTEQYIGSFRGCSVPGFETRQWNIFQILTCVDKPCGGFTCRPGWKMSEKEFFPEAGILSSIEGIKRFIIEKDCFLPAVCYANHRSPPWVEDWLKNEREKGVHPAPNGGVHVDKGTFSLESFLERKEKEE